jgi:hypothetical protein
VRAMPKRHHDSRTKTKTKKKRRSTRPLRGRWYKSKRPSGNVKLARKTSVPRTCLRDLRLSKQLGKGAWGAVFCVCQGDDCKYALKTVPLGVPVYSKHKSCFWERGGPDAWPPLKSASASDSDREDPCFRMSRDEFVHEVELARRGAKLGVGPRVHDAWICHKAHSIIHQKVFNLKHIQMGFILLERMDMTLDEASRWDKGRWFKKNMRPLKEAYYGLLNRMFKAKMVNSDLHWKNLMLKVDKDGTPIAASLKIIDFGKAKMRVPTLKDRLHVVDMWNKRGKLRLGSRTSSYY